MNDPLLWMLAGFVLGVLSTWLVVYVVVRCVEASHGIGEKT
jgi:hypothetical protein